MTSGTRHSGLARITSAPPAAEYNVQQFLGDPPPTVPPVLTAALFTNQPAAEQ
ncbi:MAG TPA: hypothetical protein H9870_03605 [Candidatus Corynebacterium avicola]|uniref:Uncharacterized protein n=1 Tax=Candidatus Corynebacterium avicola TaxID=2838527 RepID=A0A9D1UK08_9CORY|nr:hypothetical protein [Candidatus Corynebacterium avicola]